MSIHYLLHWSHSASAKLIICFWAKGKFSLNCVSSSVFITLIAYCLDDIPQAVEKLVQAAESGCPSEREKQVVLNCTRILTRILPYIFEDQDWRGFFWSTVPGAGRAGVSVMYKSLLVLDLIQLFERVLKAPAGGYITSVWLTQSTFITGGLLSYVIIVMIKCHSVYH